jgi:hypothetical protein
MRIVDYSQQGTIGFVPSSLIISVISQHRECVSNGRCWRFGQLLERYIGECRLGENTQWLLQHFTIIIAFQSLCRVNVTDWVVERYGV